MENHQLLLVGNTVKGEMKITAINYIISKCSKQVQREYKTWRDWVGKVIHWELCKKLKFDHTTKWYIHQLESMQEKEMHNINLDFEKQTIT